MLALWLPLINNLNNQGLDDAVITNNGATVDASGKIGSCYSFDGSNSFISIDDPNLYNIIQGGNQPFTIMFWIYHADSTRGIIFGDYGLSGTINFNIELATDHKIRFYWHNNPDKKFNVSVDESTWTHITIVYDGTKVIFYKNGEVQADTYANMLEERIKTSGLFYLGRDARTGTTALNGMINDFRIYDNALSPREIKEISKALLLHYMLSSAGGENLCVNSNNITTSNFVLTRSTAEGDTITLTPTTSASYAKYKASNLLYSDYKNKTYTLSFYIRRINGENDSYTDKQSNIYIGLNIPSRINNVISSSYDKYVLVDSLTDIPNDWEYHSVTCVVPDDLKTGKDDAIADTSMVTFEFVNAASGTPVQVKSIKFEIGDKATPWTPNSSDSEYSIMGYDNPIEYDVSGYGNNATKVGTITALADTPRYSTSSSFDGSSYIINNTSLIHLSNEFTIAWWGKINTWLKNWEGMFLLQNTPALNAANGTFSIGTALHATSANKMTLTIRQGGTTYPFDHYNWTYAIDEWAHYALTYNKGTIIMYQNGKSVYTSTIEDTSSTDYYYAIGHRVRKSDCQMSDFRIYNSVLSADEIKALYNAPISLSNNGTLLTQGELSEV